MAERIDAKLSGMWVINAMSYKCYGQCMVVLSLAAQTTFFFDIGTPRVKKRVWAARLGCTVCCALTWFCPGFSEINQSP